MAGFRHHYLPRFLQKGFATRKTSKNMYTFVIKKDTFFEPSLMGIGQEKYFYSKEKETNLDNIITEEEQVFNSFLESLRSMDTDSILDSEHCKDFVVHTIVRNRHLRKSFEEASNSTVESIEDKLLEPEEMKKFLLIKVKENPEIIKDPLRIELLKVAPEGCPIKILEQQMDYLIKEKLDELLNNIDPKPIFESYKNGIEKTSKTAHIEGLNISTLPEKHKDRLSSLKWSLKVLKEGAYILGDVGPLLQFYPDFEFKNYLFSNEDIYAVYFPISYRHMIVGHVENTEVLNYKFINKQSTMLSHEYIISHSKEINIKETQSLLGIKSSCVPDNFNIDELLEN